MTETAPETVTIRRDPLARLMSIYSTAPWNRLDNPDVAEAWSCVSEDMQAEEEAAQDAPLPPGRWGRVELPGYRQHTGWITEETRFGVQMAIVRDFDGIEEAAVAVGPGSQVVFLPTPLRRPEPEPEPLTALPAGSYEGYYGEADDEDQDAEPADAFAAHPEADFLMARSGPGPWFPARFDSECDGCGEPIDEGDTIRADGEGGYACEGCGEDLEDEDRMGEVPY